MSWTESDFRIGGRGQSDNRLAGGVIMSCTESDFRINQEVMFVGASMRPTTGVWGLFLRASSRVVRRGGNGNFRGY